MPTEDDEPMMRAGPFPALPAWLLFAAVIAAAAVGAAGARNFMLGPDAWAHLGQLDRCEVYENRFTGRLRFECPPPGGRHV